MSIQDIDIQEAAVVAVAVIVAAEAVIVAAAQAVAAQAVVKAEKKTLWTKHGSTM